MNKIDLSKLKLLRQTIPEDIAKQLVSVQPMPDNIIKDALEFLSEEESKAE